MASLAASAEPLDFNGLLTTLGLTKGNLASHVRKLEEAGLLEVTKEFVGRKPRTTYRCTPQGRDQVQTYLANIEAMLKASLKGDSHEPT
jgi:DNA-binding MarR family transcriptional regulator